jgi:photoactive yellow protein
MATNQTKSADELARMTRDQLDALPFGVIELAADGTILSYNAGEAELSGRKPEKVIGKNFSPKSRRAPTCATFTADSSI